MTNTNSKFEKEVNSYKNDFSTNTRIHKDFTQKTNKIPWLKGHRDYIENNDYGFGDRAFHYMWYIILAQLSTERETVKALEIGVYKGQVISLWQLIAQKLNFQIHISALSPFKGNFKKATNLFTGIILAVQKRTKIHNLYEENNYKKFVKKIFLDFNLQTRDLSLIEGKSHQRKIIKRFKQEEFDLIYIDGDHSYKGAKSDIVNYTPFLRRGGYLVMDDASYDLPGQGFNKGYKSVTDACDILSNHGFTNILNIGHNRVFKKL